jgi:hypothetical protein
MKDIIFRIPAIEELYQVSAQIAKSYIVRWKR